MAGQVSAPQIATRKVRDGAPPIVMVTAYDAPFATIVDAAGVDGIETGSGLVVEDHLGIRHDGAGQAHALAQRGGAGKIILVTRDAHLPGRIEPVDAPA